MTSRSGNRARVPDISSKKPGFSFKPGFSIQFDGNAIARF
ncbi:hypothetical protein CKA32_001509 [Geitlerinema sp. FC II]|nr:hypothetical protein CKA32_001509 [Geitlerinema sp. FC II]